MNATTTVSQSKTQTPQSYSIDEFANVGFAGPIPILSKEEAREVLTEIEAWQSSSQQQHEGNARFKLHLFLPKVNAIVHHPRLVQAVQQALVGTCSGTSCSSSSILWSSDLNSKPPQSDLYFAPHQDATYTGLQPANECLTVWIALSDPVGVLEGCMSFLPKSHLQGQLPHVEEKSKSNNMLSRGQRVLIFDHNIANEWTAIPLRAGEATLHHFHTIHTSGPNQHPHQTRVGLALRYMTSQVRQTGPVRECVTWIQSSNNKEERDRVAKHFDLEPILPLHPTSMDIQRGLDYHQDAMQREAANYFQDSSQVKAYDAQT